MLEKEKKMENCRRSIKPSLPYGHYVNSAAEMLRIILWLK